MTIATKNTYPAKDFLALCGMTWNKGFGRWESSNFDALVEHIYEKHSNIKSQISPGAEIFASCGMFLLSKFNK
jgi:hypothetical protein